MDLRITLQTTVNRALVNSRRQTDALGKLQQQVSTGKRILSPSDDPLDAVAVINTRAQDLRLDSDLGNIRTTRSALDLGVGTLQAANDILVKARSLALEAANSGNDTRAFDALADEVDALRARMLDAANTQNNGQFLFGGVRTDAKPFVVDANGNVVYQGAEERAKVPVSASQTVDTFHVGREIFQPRQRGAAVYSGPTGAAAGAGTDSATGQTTLVLAHGTTSYGPSTITSTVSGVAVGSGSAAGDTVLGPSGSHTLTLVDTSGTGASGTVSLNGGPAAAWTSADTNLRVTGPAGEVVYLDTSAITAGFDSAVDGNVPITATGTIAASGGPAVAVTFTANQVVTDTLGGVTNVNTTNVRLAGTTYVDHPGTHDVFQALAALRDDLRNVQGRTTTEQVETISGRIAELDRLRNNVLGTIGEKSAALQNLDGLETHAEDVQLEARKLTGELEGADLADVITRMQAQENLLQMTLAVSARMFDQSLLDFLR